MDKPKTEPDAPKPEDSTPSDPEAEEIERTRQLILQRRSRFIAAALAGLGGAVGSACSDSHKPPGAVVAGAAGEEPPVGGRPSVCLSSLRPDAGPGAGAPAAGRPSVCLTPLRPDAGPAAGAPAAGSGGSAGAGGSGGSAGRTPSVCLSPPIDPNEDAGT